MEKRDRILIEAENYTLHIIMPQFDEDVDVDEICKIDYSNIYGEAVTVSALLNRVGMLKASAEYSAKIKKMERDIYEAQQKNRYRREASENGSKFNVGTKDAENWVKLTENSLEESILLDSGFQIKMKNVAKAEKDLAFLDSLFWSISSKDKKLNNLIKAVSPEEFEKELIEGKLNGMVIKKIKHKMHN